MMEQAFRAILTSATSVTAIAAANRINFGQRLQGTALPAVVLSVIGDAEGLTLKGPDGLSQGRIQADCYGNTYAEAKSLSRAVRAVLHGYRGGNFRLVEHVDTRDENETGANEADRPESVSMDFMTHWRAQ